MGTHGRAGADVLQLYFAMTGLHALHVIIGIIVIGILTILDDQAATSTHRASSRTEMIGLYWHFVDIVWISCSRSSISSQCRAYSLTPLTHSLTSMKVPALTRPSDSHVLLHVQSRFVGVLMG